jgi:hypothetical protein
MFCSLTVFWSANYGLSVSTALLSLCMLTQSPSEVKSKADSACLVRREETVIGVSIFCADLINLRLLHHKYDVTSSTATHLTKTPPALTT